jgi:hypothetical protein
MRPRVIQNVPGLGVNGTPFARLRDFTRRIVRIAKAEADKHIGKPGSGSVRQGRALNKK